MALPEVQIPSFMTTLPSNGKKISYRPFTVKEEKALLMAIQEEDKENLYNVIMNVIDNCVKSKDFKSSKIAIYDVVHLITKIRTKSIGSKQTISFIDEEDGEEYTIEIDFDAFEVQKDENRQYIITLDADKKLVMRDPTIPDMIRVENMEGNNYEKTMKMVSLCADKLLIGEDDVMDMNDETEETKSAWFEKMPSDLRQKLMEFVVNVPTMSHQIEYEKKNGSKGYKSLDGNSIGFFSSF